MRVSATLSLGTYCILLCLCVTRATQMDLGGSEWRLLNKNKLLDLPASVPGYVIQALEAQKMIGDYRKGYGEYEVRWLAYDEWIFAKKFNVPPCMLKKEAVDLYMEGVDTFADVMVNGKLLGSLQNFHRSHRLAIKEHLKQGENEVQLVMKSPVIAANRTKQAHPYPVPSIVAVGGVDLYNFARKTASDYGWDWGPTFMPTGVNGLVRLEAYDHSFLTGVLVRQHFEGEKIILDVLSEFQVPPGKKGGKLILEVPELKLKAEEAVTFGAAGWQTRNIKVTTDVKSVKLWWPVGLGEHPLYDLTVTFEPDASPSEQCEGVPHIPKTVKKRVGFRNIKVIRLPIEQAMEKLGVPKWESQATDPAGPGLKEQCGGFDGQDKMTKACKPGLRCMRYTNNWWDCKNTTGESFYFEVNGVPVYAKGSNLIPMHVTHSEVQKSYIDQLLQYAVEGNQNMIRIWGGGKYQRQELYDWCDEHGMMVWMETMFACAPYPTHKEFMVEVRQEVVYQAIRLGSHPSIVLWGGNNEVEWSFDWYQPTRDNRELYKEDFMKLFVDLIGGTFHELDPSRAYIETSPTNGFDPKTGQKRWGAVNDPMFGDVHHYWYTPDCTDYHAYPPAKFVSEHGFQAFPSFSSLKPATSPSDWAVMSQQNHYRQKRINGTSEVLAQMKYHFHVPDNWASTGKQEEDEEKYKSWLYLTQVQQAMCYEASFGAWRRWRSDSLALTMGVLYWQLNDIWPGASWTTLNHDLRWKPSHYTAQKVFANLALVGLYDKHVGSLRVFVINDYPTAEKVTLDLYLHSTRDKSGSDCPKPFATVEQTVPPVSAVELYSIPRKDLVSKMSEGEVHAYVHAVLKTQKGVRQSPSFTPGAIPLPTVTEAGTLEGEGVLGGIPKATLGPEDVDLRELVRSAKTELKSYPRWGNVLGEETSRRRTLLQVEDGTTDAEKSDTEKSDTEKSDTEKSDTEKMAGVVATDKADGEDAPVRAGGDSGTEELTIWLTKFKDMEKLSNPEISFSDVKELSATDVSFTVTSKGVAVMMVLETESKGHFDKNLITLHPCRPVTIIFKGREPVKGEDLVKNLHVTSLYDAQA